MIRSRIFPQHITSLALVVGMLLLAFAREVETPANAQVATPPSPSTPVGPSPTPAVPDTREQQLAEELLANEPGVYGYVVMATDGSLIASINSQTPFVTASLYKLLLMADIFQRIEMGWLSADDVVPLDGRHFLEGTDNYFTTAEIGTPYTLQEYLFAVGAYSSNVAARTLLQFTSREGLRNTALAIGMTNTYLFTDPLLIPNWPEEPGPDAPPEEFALAQQYLRESAQTGPVNVTTPLDMARYGIAIANDALLSPWVSEQVALVLQEQAIRDRIPYLLEGDVFTINKPGNLVDAVNDMGVLYLPEGARSLAILSLAVPNTDRATEIEQRLAVIATGWAGITPQVISWREDA